MATRKKKLDYKPFPKEQAYRSGCKVSWHYYKDEADAKMASVAALHNRKIDEGLGFDWGYCAPGSLKLVKEGEYAGLYEVCVP